ncbi:benenodin family lasso peptide [Caulobacter sp.]|nr:benenodin family lasso peptide [Caulobacter sp.]MBO9547122.1 benenodin family lasso peptide [Caulobacter sp.]
MQRIEDHIEDALVDLGAVSVETKGAQPDVFELGIGQEPTGISED